MFFFKNLMHRRIVPIVHGAGFVALLIILLLTGCPQTGSPPADTKVSLNGEWTDDYGSGYNITSSSLEYYTAESTWEEVTYPAENIKGSIKEIKNFSKDAGVIIVQITTSTTTGQANKFIGVYYKDCTASHIFFANAIDASWNLILIDNLNEAKNTFTVDNVTTHVSSWGSGYNR
ncbi:MAG: hypothetical protein LBC76_07750 [Treponema sp.]|jgi:hypothetical protein|nr:hypothetical protein [Treponema sp.]